MRSTNAYSDFESYLAAVEDFTDKVLIPNEPRIAEEMCVPEDITQAMRDLGLFGISIPEEYGGLDCSQEEQVRLTFAFTRGSAVYRSRFSTTIGLTSQAILDFATEDQKRAWLPRMATGEVTGAFALTEPEAGTDAGGLKTVARKEGAAYVLNGHKRYITNAPDADVFLVMARTDETQKGSRGVSAFLVERGTPGLEPLPPTPLLGQHGSRVGDCLLYTSDAADE